MSMYMYLDNGILVTSIGVNIVYIQMLSRFHSCSACQRL